MATAATPIYQHNVNFQLRPEEECVWLAWHKPCDCNLSCGGWECKYFTFTSLLRLLQEKESLSTGNSSVAGMQKQWQIVSVGSSCSCILSEKHFFSTFQSYCFQRDHKVTWYILKLLSRVQIFITINLNQWDKLKKIAFYNTQYFHLGLKHDTIDSHIHL